MPSPPTVHHNDVVPPEEALRELTAATDQLLAGLDGLSDAQVAGPSLLPGWTRGHVLTHLARNAEGGTRLLGWARTGVPSYEYESWRHGPAQSRQEQTARRT
jgi:maleylpyruvate isomerase